MEEVTEQVAFLKGEVHALLLFAQTLAIAHPERTLLLAGLATAEQKGLAQIEGELVSDATIEGFRYAVDRIRNALKGIPES